MRIQSCEGREIYERFAERQFGAIERISVTPLSGGLDSCNVSKVEVTLSSDSSSRKRCFVAKHLRGRAVRELQVYESLRASGRSSLAPLLLGMHRVSPDEAYLFLEWVKTTPSWPWKSKEATLAVIRRLADLHAQPAAHFQAALADSALEEEMSISAAATAEAYARSCHTCRRAGVKPMRRALERVAADVNRIRSYVMAETGVVPLHGDVHSGNAAVRFAAGRNEALLLDWGRARLGSPLEDISSWLQSLSYWEPAVKRSHDTLLERYVGWTGWRGGVNHRIRQLYWLAAASNAMAGALRYHLTVLGDISRPQNVRSRSAGAVRDWLRIVRRADAYWRQTSVHNRQISPIRSAGR